MHDQHGGIKVASFVLVVHGGAGALNRQTITAKLNCQYMAKLKQSLETGSSILTDGGSSLDAVEQAIKVFEDSHLFNAGKGAVLNKEGRAELDASIMDGRTHQAGAVASVTTIRNPISAARLVMNKTPHVMLVADGAEEIAREAGLEIVGLSYFQTEKHWLHLEKAGTVGAVALDRYGDLAAGTSTGGIQGKLKGRVGDSPIIGAGTYADNETCAVSATGQGEYFIRQVVAYDIVARMRYGGCALKEAAWEAIHGTLTKSGGKGGVIAVDKDGNVAMPFNSLGMFRGYVKNDQQPYTYIFEE
ncbi:MAG: isoaspartyl peptidase/L-asparaginase [Candidatus Melainabacteria bacterium]|nr:isoaspartyl peptidase/L-asparaginase [Candidatus Melainabacteria bacterium]